MWRRATENASRAQRDFGLQRAAAAARLASQTARLLTVARESERQTDRQTERDTHSSALSLRLVVAARSLAQSPQQLQRTELSLRTATRLPPPSLGPFFSHTNTVVGRLARCAGCICSMQRNSTQPNASKQALARRLALAQQNRYKVNLDSWPPRALAGSCAWRHQSTPASLLLIRTQTNLVHNNYM